MAALLLCGGASAQDRFSVPSTASPQAREALTAMYVMLRKYPAMGKPASTAEWDKLNEQLGPLMAASIKQTTDRLGVQVFEDRLGGVPVLRVRPANWKPTGRTLVYLHGGGYVFFSARTSLTVPALMASQSGDEVISVDYTLAPHADWKGITDQVLAAWRGLLAEGVDPRSAGLFGDSAGGGMAAGAVLKMRDQAVPLPGALYLMSPWADITATGDTIMTLAAWDPTLESQMLSWGASAYAKPADQKNPYVSPVYGDYSRAFPPTLIQAGTREIFLSHAVRQYQAIRAGGHEAVLDIYEGMPHVWEALAPAIPETQTAIARASDFFHSHLNKDH